VHLMNVGKYRLVNFQKVWHRMIVPLVGVGS
jgi:hypothetical protein